MDTRFDHTRCLPHGKDIVLEKNYNTYSFWDWNTIFGFKETIFSLETKLKNWLSSIVSTRNYDNKQQIHVIYQT
jgi:hypothetical protein